MTHEIDRIEHYFEGDALVIPFTARNEDDPNEEFKDLTGASIDWELRDHQYADAMLTSDDPGVAVNLVDAQNGEFEVRIETNATETFRGTHVQVVRITDGTGNQSTSMGEIAIEGLGPDS